MTPGASEDSGSDGLGRDGGGDGGWTVEVQSGDGREPRTLRFSRRGVRWGGLLAGTLLVGALALILWMSWGTWRQAGISEVRRENHRLRAQLRSADRTVDRLAGQLNRMAAQEERFRILAGLPLLDDELRQVGIGGPGADAGSGPAVAGEAGGRGALARTAPGSRSLDHLLRRADLLHASLREAADSMAAHRERLLSRPSIQPVPEDLSWISSGFSHSRYHPVLHISRPHEGVDVSAPRGAPIRATANGRVAEVERRRGYGKVVKIDHGERFETLYAHAAEITVRRGDRVERGEVIGRVGETGLTSGPNVHYEVHVEGRPVNPYRYFVDARIPQ